LTSWLEPLFVWLATPLSGADTHEIAPWAYWHARLMVLSWSLLLPIGMLIARFFKIAPGQDWPNVLDRKFWWRSHLWLQTAGVLAMTVGLALVFWRAGLAARVARLHHWAGWIAVLIGWAQIVGGVMRGDKGGPTAATLRGDHYDMTRRRIIFEYVHKHLGWIAIPFAIVATGAGLALVDAPRWMPLTLSIWWVFLISTFVYLQRDGRCIDTYQAIWGPDESHPGARRAPIGFGIRKAGSDKS
jgi:hypothetical protein